MAGSVCKHCHEASASFPLLSYFSHRIEMNCKRKGISSCCLLGIWVGRGGSFISSRQKSYSLFSRFKYDVEGRDTLFNDLMSGFLCCISKEVFNSKTPFKGIP